LPSAAIFCDALSSGDPGKETITTSPAESLTEGAGT
jgi:hypothetical protein